MAAKKKKTKAATKTTTTKAKAAADKLYVAEVRELVGLMVENDLTTLELVNGDLKVTLGRGTPVAQVAGAAPAVVAAAPAAAPAPVAAAPAESAQATPADDLVDIVSPMVGTFYAAPSPDSDPFISSGDRVNAETVVCIVEAMKVMNEIKAECSGTIAEIAVSNGQPVEFGQVLFRVKP